MSNKFLLKHRLLLCKLLFPDFVERYKNLEYVSTRRLEHIRYLIELSYSFQHNKTAFYNKFIDSVNIKSLKHNSIVDFDIPYETLVDYYLESGQFKLRNGDGIEEVGKIKKQPPINKAEQEFLCLIKHGFTPRELNVVCDLNHHISVYVKMHRLRLKCLYDKDKRKMRVPGYTGARREGIVIRFWSSCKLNIINRVKRISVNLFA